MRLTIPFASFALVLGISNFSDAQVIFVQPNWAPTPIFVCHSFALQEGIPVTAAKPANSLSTSESRYGNAAIIPAPVQIVVAPPRNVTVERYYFVPSPMEPIVPPQAGSKAVAKERIASPLGEVIIREYFVMDQPASSKHQGDSARETTPSTTPQNSSQDKSVPPKADKLDKPKWSDEFDKTEKAPKSNSDTPAPAETKDPDAAVPAEEPKDSDPPADEKKDAAPTDPIPPATTPGGAV